MSITENNPYRTLGLLVGMTAREQTKQINRLKKLIEAEQDSRDDFSFPALGNLLRTLDCVEEAASKLNLDSDKLNAALFWFWGGNPITDEVAFDALKDGDIEAAYQIWDKLTTTTNAAGKRLWNAVTMKNLSAFHNSSVLYFITKKGSFVSAVVANIKFIESDYFDIFIKEAVDETYRVVKKDIELIFLKSIFDNTDNIKIAELIKYLNDYDFSAKQDFLKSVVQKPIAQIEQKIELTKNKRKASKANAVKAGAELFTATVNFLLQLKSIVGVNDLKYSSVADKVANEILQCSIDYFNDSQEKDSNSNYAEIALKLAKQAETIAVGNLTKDRVKDSINTLEEMNDREISQAIDLLKSVKDAYETNESQIRAKVRIIEETDIQIKLGYKSINWSAVEDNIKNSINWKNVNDLLATVLSDNKLKKIKESDKDEQKKIFLELANWLKEYSLKSSTISVIIDKYKKIPPKLPFKIISSVLTNTDKNSKILPVTNPLYSKHTRYVGLKIKVECYKNKCITLFIKYIGPNGRCSSNAEISPKGYTNSITVNIDTNTTVIDISGWGNSDKCSYDIGKHRIEVYVDGYVIHCFDFFVDLAPSEKLEIELKNAENKLIEIKKTEFFKYELIVANTQMSEIHKFQLFRSNLTKQMQISDQQKKITSIQQKATNEKKKQIEQQNQIINKIKSDLQIAEY